MLRAFRGVALAVLFAAAAGAGAAIIAEWVQRGG
jgi:hypothetical protein